MVYKYNTKGFQDKRKSLRANLTEEERKVWSILRSRKMRGFRFLRQYSIGVYILDFYCPKLRLAIEIDGGQHNKELEMKRDRKRTDYLNQNNIEVIRFWNNEVMSNLDGVYQIVAVTIDRINNPS